MVHRVTKSQIRLKQLRTACLGVSLSSGPHCSSCSTLFHKWKHRTHGSSVSNKFPTLPEGKPWIDFIGSSLRRGWCLGSFSPIPLLAKASHLSILHKRPALPAVLFGCSLWTAVKSITTEPPFGCHTRFLHTVKCFCSGVALYCWVRCRHVAIPQFVYPFSC